MKVVILQPSYIPWRGYFHQIAKADLFIFYDDVQYDTRGWRNRNRVKTPSGSTWLTIPVHKHGAQTDNIPINKIEIAWERPWNEEHSKTIQFSYKKAPHFRRYSNLIEEMYARKDPLLADFTIASTISIAREIGISHTRFLRSSELQAEGAKTDRLISLLLNVGASHYISGPSARDYIETEKFQHHGISLEYMDYSYSDYPQLYPPFDPQLSILDLMMMVGPDTLSYFK